MTAQGVNKYVLDGLAVSGVLAVHAASALSGAEMDPICRPIGRSVIEGSVHEGLEQQRPVTVHHLPVVRQAACRQGQDLACQPAHGNPRKNQEAAVRDDELKIAFPLFGAPSDPGIARRHHPGRTGKLQAGQIAAGQLAGLDEIAQMGAEGDAVFEIMVTVDVLLEQGIKIPVGSLDKVKGQGIEIAGASGHGGLSVAIRSADDASWPGCSRVPKRRQSESPLIPQVLEKSPAFFILEFAGRSFPFEQFAEGFRQLGQTEVGKIVDGFTDERKLGSTEITAREGNLRGKHSCSPLLLFLPYPNAKRMSRKKCSQAKIFHKPWAEVVLDDWDCRNQSEKLCRQSANQVTRGRADQAAKTTEMRCANIRKTDIRVG